MKHRLLHIFALLILATGVAASKNIEDSGNTKVKNTEDAKDYRGRLDVSAAITDMYVAPNEDVYIGNRIGDAFKVNVSDSVWRRCFHKAEDEWKNPHIDHIGGIDGKIVFAGNGFELAKLDEFPRNKNGDDYDQGAMVFSSDSCKTWEDIAIDENYTDAMFTDGESKIWLCGIKRKMCYSEDGGKLPATRNEEHR